MNGEAEAKANVRARAAAIFMVATAMSLCGAGTFLGLSLDNRAMIGSDDRANRSKSRHEDFYYFLTLALIIHDGLYSFRSPFPTSEE